MKINTHNLSNPALFIQNYIKIIDRKGQLVDFTLNPQQEQLLTEMDKFNVVLKSRQLGVTTLSCAYSIWLAICHPNTSCLLMAHSLYSAECIFEKLKQLYSSIPAEVCPALVEGRPNELELENGSKIIVAHCGAKIPARVGIFRFVHVSEAAFCNENIDKQILAIEQCLTPNGQIIVESTANGFNFFSKLYSKAAQGENMYKPFFFSWVDDKLMFADDYKWSVERYIELYGKLPTLDELDNTEHSLYCRGASIEQLAWRRLRIYGNMGGEGQFMQEFPSTVSEAFVYN